jgi:hypothetical protein
VSKANDSNTFTTANNNITTTTTFIEDSFFDINIKKDGCGRTNSIITGPGRRIA